MIIAFTGAGISAASGIPTFADQPGIRDRLSRPFADRHPDEYRETIGKMRETCMKAEPNDAHLALAEHGIPVITMNVDGLHGKAGSDFVLEIHGNLKDDTIVLYGDPAPGYQTAEEWIGRMLPGDVLLVVGTSHYTAITGRLIRLARLCGAEIREINQDAEHALRPLLESLTPAKGDFKTFMERDGDGPGIPMPFPYQTGGWAAP